MKAQKWEELSKTQKVVGVSAAVLVAALLGSELFSSGSSGSDDPSDHVRRPMIRIGARVSTDRGYAGCRQVEDTDKFTALLTAKDTTAALAFLDQADCQLPPEGTSGTVEDSNGWHSSVCIRQVGHPFCSWIPVAIANQVE